MRSIPSPRQWRARLLQLATFTGCLAAAAPASALDYQVHGYAAQGFVYSDENNFFGESSDGSFDYYEAGLNAVLQVSPRLLFAGQVAIRDAGVSDDGSFGLDYAVADYRFLSRVDAAAGVRAGKIKNAMGFYNETRDVVFTRPGILMPSVYSDNQNQRSLIFSAPGAQLYGTRTLGHHDLSVSAIAHVDRDVHRSDERLLIDLGGLPFDLRIEDSWNAQVMDTFNGGRWQLAASYFFGRFTLTTPDPIGLAGRFDVGLIQFSARYNASAFTITAEYVLNPNDNVLTANGVPVLVQNIVAEGGYLQGEYRLSPRWRLMARYDAVFLDRDDRSGRRFAAANPGADRRSRFSRDLTIGARWLPSEHWGIWGEYHWIHGTSLLQREENPNGPGDTRWSLILLMAGFRF